LLVGCLAFIHNAAGGLALVFLVEACVGDVAVSLITLGVIVVVIAVTTIR
jgi:hypothetical protein